MSTLIKFNNCSICFKREYDDVHSIDNKHVSNIVLGGALVGNVNFHQYLYIQSNRKQCMLLYMIEVFIASYIICFVLV